MKVCRTDCLYHYLLGGNESLSSILEQGLLPLSALPDSQRRQEVEAFYRALYAAFAEPVLKRPYQNSGVFLTPIDFRQLPGTALANLTRIAIPLDAIQADSAIVTHETEGRRFVALCSRQSLEEAAQAWPEESIRAWFGRDKNMIFYHVPQVAVFQDGGIPIRPEWVEQ